MQSIGLLSEKCVFLITLMNFRFPRNLIRDYTELFKKKVQSLKSRKTKQQLQTKAHLKH